MAEIKEINVLSAEKEKIKKEKHPHRIDFDKNQNEIQPLAYVACFIYFIVLIVVYY